MRKVTVLYPDSMVQKDARRWLVRLDSDRPLSAEEQNELSLWLENPVHQQELQRLSQMWAQADILANLAVPLRRSTWPDRLVVFLKDLFGVVNARTLLATSAVVVVAVGLAMSFLYKDEGFSATYQTAIGEVREELLPDGSTLHLNTNSLVKVDFTDKVRKVRLLKGEGYFDVAKNPGRPFEVFVADGIARAVGTAFAVRLNQGEVSVTVHEGLVDYLALLPPEPVSGEQAALRADLVGGDPVSESSYERQKVASLGYRQMGVFQTKESQASGEASEQGALISVSKLLAFEKLGNQLAWTEGYLEFSGESLGYVIEEVNRYSHTTIKIDSPELRELKLGGRFRVGELDALLEVLETGFQVEVNNTGHELITLSLLHDD